MNRTRSIALFAVAALSIGVAASAEPTGSGPVDVSTVSLNGSRTLSVLTSGGGTALGELALGTTDSAPFDTVVTDVTYDHVGYQVDAQLSNLYKFDPASGNYTCTTDDNLRIPATLFSVSFPTATALSDVSATVAPIFDVTGDLTSVLGLTGDAGLVDVDVEGNLWEEVLDPATSPLPIGLQTLNTDTFTSAMGFTECDGAQTSGDSVFLQVGGANGLASLLSTITSSITTANTTVGDYVTDGVLDLAVVKQVVYDSLGATGQAAWDTLEATDPNTLDAAVNALTATLQTLTDLVGQTGVYMSFPQLDLDRPNVAAPAGTYRGRMQITITDTTGPTAP